MIQKLKQQEHSKQQKEYTHRNIKRKYSDRQICLIKDPTD